MTTGEFFTSPVLPVVLLFSAAGAWFACPRTSSRLWFFVLAPVLVGLLWLVVGAAIMLPLALVELISGASPGAELHFWLTNIVTLLIYVLFCAMLRRDGKRGLRMMGHGSNTGRCFNPSGTSLPDTASSRRFGLH